MIIGIDLDSTLIETNAVAIAAKELNFPISNKDTLHWNHLNFPPELKARIYEYFVDPVSMCDNARPIKGTQETIRKWYDQGHKIVLITARGNILRESTIEMVHRLYPEIGTVEFVEMNTSKIAIMKEKGVEVWIDDAPHGILDALKEGIPAYMVSNNYTKYNWYVRDDTRLKGVVKTISEINFGDKMQDLRQEIDQLKAYVNYLSDNLNMVINEVKTLRLINEVKTLQNSDH